MIQKQFLIDHVMNNVYLDSCVCHQSGIDLLLEIIPVKNLMFDSELVSAVRGIDPETGQYFDDTKRFVDNLSISDVDKADVFDNDERRVFLHLDAFLNDQLDSPT